MTMTPVHAEPRSRTSRAFTLIEMLAVVTIIAILLALAVTAGVIVIGRQDVATTKGLLSSLDRALEEYIVEVGTIPSYNVEAYFGVPGEYLTSGDSSAGGTGGGSQPTNDPDDMSPDSFYQNRSCPRHPDASVFIRQAAGVGAVDDIIGGMPDRYLITTTVSVDAQDTRINNKDTTPSIMDPWGDPAQWAALSNDPTSNPWPILNDSAHLIFYVHPNNKLAQDLYGQCVNGRPYFFSAGPDGLYGTTSQFSPDGSISINELIASPSGGGEGLTTDFALEGLLDNIYSYPVGPVHDDQPFNETYR